MNTITLPYDINNGDALDADKVMANSNEIVAVYNADVGGKTGNIVTTSDIDTDSSMAANSDSKIPSQKAVKTAIAAKVINRAFTWYLDGTSIVADEVGAKYISPQAMTSVRVSAKTVSGTATIRIQKGTTDIVNSISVTSTLGHTTSFSSAAIAQYDIVTLDITAASSCVGLTVTLEATQP